MSKKPMAGKRIQDIPQTAIRIEPAVIDQLNRFCADHPLRPRRDSVIEVAIIEYVEREQDRIAEARSAQYSTNARARHRKRAGRELANRASGAGYAWHQKQVAELHSKA